jgi:hypothetical protein
MSDTLENLNVNNCVAMARQGAFRDPPMLPWIVSSSSYKQGSAEATEQLLGSFKSLAEAVDGAMAGIAARIFPLPPKPSDDHVHALPVTPIAASEGIKDNDGRKSCEMYAKSLRGILSDLAMVQRDGEGMQLAALRGEPVPAKSPPLPAIGAPTAAALPARALTGRPAKVGLFCPF